MKFLRLITRKFLLTVNIITVAVFILACLAPFINPAYYWPLSFLGLAFPFILLLVAAFLLFWLLIQPKYALFSFIALLIGWKSIAVFFAFNHADKPAVPTPGSINIMSYNVRYFKTFEGNGSGDKKLRSDIMQLIRDQRPDILCLQEFYTSENPKDYDNREYISQTMNLPYRYFSSDYNFKNNHSGVIIFSRYPVIRAQKLKLMQESPSESVVFADLVKGSDTIRVFTMHLQSIYLNKKDLETLDKLKLRQDTGFVGSRTILQKIRKAFVKRGGQAVTVAAEIRQSPYPVIVCGDFNDTPNSYAYFKIRDGLQDAFLSKGFGIGATYAGISPTLRIDYIFLGRRIRVNYFERIRRELSDHYPIVANVSLTPGGRR